MSSDTTSSSLIVVVELLPFEIDLQFDQSVQGRRHLMSSDGNAVQPYGKRDLSLNRMAIDTALLSEKMKSYLNNYFSTAFSGKNSSSYAKFNTVILSMMQRRQAQQEMDYYYFIENTPSRPYKRDPMIRGLASDANIAVRFGGAAVFLRDGSSSVPKTTIVQSLELDALTDSDHLLLYSLQNSSYTSGLSTVQSLSIAIISNPTATDPIVSAQENTVNASGINKTLIIGLTVGASALTLLAFILFFVYRRSSFNSERNKVIKKSSTNELSDHELSPSPVNMISVKVESSFDDNVSEYTESVYSAPKRRKWTNLPQDVESITRKQDDPSFYERVDSESFCKYPDDEKSTGCADEGDIPKITISDRFTPRYIESSENHNDSFTSDESMDVAEHLRRAHPKERSSGKKFRSSGMNTRYSENIKDPSGSRLEPTDLFIDDTFAASKGKLEEFPQYLARDDNSTLSSLGSFSYSIEPIGDHSTTISSTV